MAVLDALARTGCLRTRSPRRTDAISLQVSTSNTKKADATMTRRHPTMTTEIPTIHETVVDGVQTFWTQAGPPFTATLTFRVGIADERLVERGITHLVEHLAMSPLREVTHPYNGGVGMDATSMWAAGSEADVVDFMGRLTDELSDLSAERLDTEAGVLIAESMRFRSTSFTSMLAFRFGPAGPGVMAYPEYGLRRVTVGDLRRWAAEWFTAENAVLILTGPPPDNMRLSLPSGRRHSFELPPDCRHYSPVDKTRISTQEDGVAVGGFGARSVPLRMAADAVRMRAEEHMRHELGRVYAVAHEYAPLTGDEVFVYWGSDSEQVHAGEVATAFNSVLDSVVDEGPTHAELERMVSMTEQMHVMDPLALARGEVFRIANDVLTGHDSMEMERWIPEMRAVTPESGAEALRGIMPGAMAIASASGLVGFSPDSEPDEDQTKGKTYRYKVGDIKRRYILGEDALSSVEDGSCLTVRFDEVVLSEHQEGGRRVIIDRHGTYLGIDPSTRKLREMVAVLDIRLPPDVDIPQSRS